jgi:SOS-response transcriptional repressor LexA
VVGQVRQARVSLVASDEVPESERFVEYLPVYSLQAAAGYFGTGHEVELEGWVQVEGRVTDDMFVAQAVGRSMEPRISDGDLCVFRHHRGGARQGKVVLAQWSGVDDPETGGSYAIKRYSSEKNVNDGELVGWSVTLSPLNPEFEPIPLSAAVEDEVQVIAELIDVLRAPVEDQKVRGHAAVESEA